MVRELLWAAGKGHLKLLSHVPCTEGASDVISFANPSCVGTETKPSKKHWGFCHPELSSILKVSPSAGGFPRRNEVPALRESPPAPETLGGPPSHVAWAMFNKDGDLDEALPEVQAFLGSLPQASQPHLCPWKGDGTGCAGCHLQTTGRKGGYQE